LTNNNFRAQAKSEIPTQNEDVLTDSDCKYESEITKNTILVPDQTRRKLFTDNETGNVQKAVNWLCMIIFESSAPKPFQNNSILCTEGEKCTIFTRRAVCSPRVLQSTKGKNHSLPRCIYYFLHDPTTLIEKSGIF
jgi:hypothetical protein